MIADQNDAPPLEIKDFVDKIDSRGGFFQGIATEINDFKLELESALSEKSIERSRLIKSEIDQSTVISAEQRQYVQQLINALALPTEIEEKDEYYDEEHRSVRVRSYRMN